MDSSESAIRHHWVAPVEEIWTFAAVVCPLHTLFCLSYFHSGLSFSAVSRGRSSLHYLFPRPLPLLFNALCPTKLTGSCAQRQTLNPDLPSGVFFLNYTWCSTSSCTFCLHVQEKPRPSIPWVHLHVVISPSSLVPLVRAWELTVAHTGSRMSLCVSYSLSASLSVLVKLVWF